MRDIEGDGPWTEQPNYQKTTDDATIKAALLAIVPFSKLPENHPAVVNLHPPYGPVNKQLNEQNGKWVPRQLVDDKYDVYPQGCSGLADKAAHLRELSKDDQLRAKRRDEEAEAAAAAVIVATQVAIETGAPRPPGTTSTGKTFWTKVPHDSDFKKHLGDPPFAIPVKDLKKRAIEIGSLMGMDPKQVKTAHTRLVKQKILHYQ
jgi:hypothetical protein